MKSQDDRVIVEQLVLEIAELQAENNREQWAENDGDDDGIRRTVVTTLAKIGFDEAGISGVRPLLLEMLKRREISVRSTLFDLPPGEKTDISADMEGWYMSREDADKVRDRLLPGKRENNSTARSGTTEKAAPELALADDDGQAETLRKRWALIEGLSAMWPSIDGDLREGSRNGLSEVANAKHGYWKVRPALNWAEERGKIQRDKAEAFVRANGESDISVIVRAMLARN